MIILSISLSYCAILFMTCLLYMNLDYSTNILASRHSTKTFFYLLLHPCSVLRGWGQIGIKLETKHIIYQKLKKVNKCFCRKRISKITGLSYSVFKYVFYRPEHNTKEGCYEIKF